MAITAETRNSIIELVVTAYDSAPGTDLLTELTAIIDGGGTLADVATELTTRDEWTSEYPSFQTAEEFAAEWLGRLVPEADADALAEGVAVAVGLINGGASFADLIIEAQGFLAAADEEDEAFGTSAANFNNKVEVATYHTVTLENADQSEVALDEVTSDDDSVTAANGSLDGTSGLGTTFTLTTGADEFVGGLLNDTFISGNATNAAGGQTLTALDDLDGGAGEDHSEDQ